MNTFIITYNDHKLVTAIAYIKGVNISCDGGILGKIITPRDAMERFMQLRAIVPDIRLIRQS